MAIVKCPDCEKEFSDFAKACPNCARPNTAQVALAKKKNYGVGFAAYSISLAVGYILWQVSESATLGKGIGATLGFAGLVGLFSILFRVIYHLLQRV
jgi:hypothetical protein